MLHQLLTYNYHTNEKLARYLLELNPGEDITKLFNHILLAQHIWNCRILNLETHIKNIFTDLNANDWIDANKSYYHTSVEIINQLDFDNQITYKNLAGEIFTNTISDILLHVCNHATYHRGQIAIMLRQQNFKPIPTDYILYKRHLNENI